MSAVLGILVVFVTALLMRALPRLLQGVSTGERRVSEFGDSTTHHLLIDLIRSNGGRLVRATPNFTLSGPQDYPALFHALMARIPRAALERWEWLSSPLWEALHAVLIYVFALAWLERTGTASAPSLALLVACAWVVTPAFTRDPSRGSYLNERVFGFFLSNLFFLAMIANVTAGSPVAAAIAILAGGLVALSSKFSMQAIVFLTPIVSLVLLDLWPVGILAAALALAIVISRGYALFVWRGTLRHSSFYARILVKIHDYTTSFSIAQLVEGLTLCLSGLIHLRRNDARRGCAALYRHPFVQALADMPMVWIALATLAFTPVRDGLAALTVAAAIVGLATMTDRLKFLGEGARYLDYAVLPAVFMLAAAGHLALVAALALYGVLRQLLVFRRVWRSSQPSGLAFRELSDWVVGLAPQTILSVPGRLVFPLAYHARAHRFVWWFINAPDAGLEPRWRALFANGGRYPFPAPDKVSQARSLYDADLVVLHKPSVEGARVAWGIDYGRMQGKAVFENADFLVLRLDPGAVAA